MNPEICPITVTEIHFALESTPRPFWRAGLLLSMSCFFLFSHRTQGTTDFTAAVARQGRRRGGKTGGKVKKQRKKKTDRKGKAAATKRKDAATPHDSLISIWSCGRRCSLGRPRAHGDDGLGFGGGLCLKMSVDTFGQGGEVGRANANALFCKIS